MKKLLLIVFVLSVLVVPTFAFAQEEASASATPTPEQKNHYILPYPGLLPDSPLYQFKVLRDRIVEFLISDPIKKAQFHILQADKRLNAGIALVNERQSKEPLAESTISKGINYLDASLGDIKQAHEQGINTDEVAKKLNDSATAHIYNLTTLEKNVSSDMKPKFSDLITRVESVQKQAAALVKKK